MAVRVDEVVGVSCGDMLNPEGNSVGEQSDGRCGVYPDNGDAGSERYGWAMRDVSREHRFCCADNVYPERGVYSNDSSSVHDDRLKN